MESKDIKENLQLFIESTGWTLIQAEIDKKIKEYTDILTGDILPDTVEPEMNVIKYTGHDIARAARGCRKELKELPHRLMTAHDPVKTGRPKV